MAGGLLLPGITGTHTQLADLLGAGLPFSPQGLGLFWPDGLATPFGEEARQDCEMKATRILRA